MSTAIAVRGVIPAGYVPGFVCTLKTCDVKVWGFVKYQPSVAGNALFLAVFYVIAALQLWLGIKYRTPLIFLAMISGLTLETVGYIARLMLHGDPFVQAYFLMYMVCLTTAPVFFAAAIYLCLSRIVVIYGEELSRVKPRTYTFVFMAGDFISLVVQAVGGGIAASAPLTHQTQIEAGTHILVAGLALQVASLLVFFVVAAEYALRVYKNRRDLSTVHEELYRGRKFRLFLGALGLASVCIFTRSVFRVIELQEGFGGRLANNQVSFMILDGVMCIIACISLTAFHPGVGFGREGWAASVYPFFYPDPRKERDGNAESGEGSEGATPDETTMVNKNG